MRLKMTAMANDLSVNYNDKDYALSLDQRIWMYHAEDRTYYRMFMPGYDSIIEINDGWDFNGDVFAPTFKPSLLTEGHISGKPRNHVFIANGLIEFLTDCTHELAGHKGVELPKLRDWPEWARFWEPGDTE